MVDVADEVKWSQELRLTLPTSVSMSDIDGASLHVTVWDYDEEDDDDALGTIVQTLDRDGCEQVKRTVMGEGDLFSFLISFAYEITPVGMARLRWSPSEMPWNVHLSARGLTITRRRWRGAEAGIAFATISPAFSNEQRATISFRVAHPDGGKHMYLGVVACATVASVASVANYAVAGAAQSPASPTPAVGDAGSVILLNLYSGRCFMGRSAENHSRMLRGQLDRASCRALDGELRGVIVRMRVDLALRRLYFAVGEGEWIDAGADLPLIVRPCALLGDDEGAQLTIHEKFIKVESSRNEDGQRRPSTFEDANSRRLVRQMTTNVTSKRQQSPTRTFREN